jgi:hypothetical protein
MASIKCFRRSCRVGVDISRIRMPDDHHPFPRRDPKDLGAIKTEDRVSRLPTRKEQADDPLYVIVDKCRTRHSLDRAFLAALLDGQTPRAGRGAVATGGRLLLMVEPIKPYPVRQTGAGGWQVVSDFAFSGVRDDRWWCIGHMVRGSRTRDDPPIQGR